MTTDSLLKTLKDKSRTCFDEKRMLKSTTGIYMQLLDRRNDHKAVRTTREHFACSPLILAKVWASDSDKLRFLDFKAVRCFVTAGLDS